MASMIARVSLIEMLAGAPSRIGIDQINSFASWSARQPGNLHAFDQRRRDLQVKHR